VSFRRSPARNSTKAYSAACLRAIVIATSLVTSVARAEEGWVTRIYGGSAGPNILTIGDTIEVRTENLDGWLISKVEAGYLNDDPFVRKYWRDFGPIMTTEGFAWSDLIGYPPSQPITNKYGAALKALVQKVPAETWRSSIQEARGAWNGFLRRKAGDLRLVIDNVRFETLKPDGVELVALPEEGEGPTVFHSAYRLVRNADNNATWQQLLRQFKFTRPVRITLGLPLTNGTWVLMPTKIVSSADPAKSPILLQLVNIGWLLAAAVFILLALILFLFLAVRTDLIRDTDAARRPAVGEKLVYPISLARSQMALWFFLVMAAYLLIWLTTDRLDGLNEQMLELIGISAATGLGAALISAGKGPARTLSEEETRAKDNTVSVAEREAATQRVPLLKAQSDRLNKANPFMRLMDDLLTEDGAISFHRFQMLGWTFVLGIIFVSRVCDSYAMPEFSGTVLALMGISSGTYLGFKLPAAK
jgi:hypothetical protein